MNWDDYKPFEKAAILSSDGEFINGVEYYGRRWVLYAYQYELWEVVYDPNDNSIESVEILKKNRAGLYSAKVSIEDILWINCIQCNSCIQKENAQY